VIASDFGVPGYAQTTNYNYLAVSSWSCQGNRGNQAAGTWANAINNFGNSQLGATTSAIQAAMKQKLNDANITILISAFGETELAASLGEDPVTCGESLGAFVLNNNFDGATINWRDTSSMTAGTGEGWLIKFVGALRGKIPNKVVTLSAYASFFSPSYTPGGGIAAVNKQVGNLINFYNVIYYNQGATVW
jgi:chitinase